MKKAKLFKSVFQGFQFLSLSMLFVYVGCAKVPDATVATTTTPAVTPAPTPAPTVAPTYLYVASGACYSGAGNTVFTNATSSNLIFRINTATGIRESVVADYSASPSQVGDSPASIVNIDSNYFYALVENTTNPGVRRIEKVEKKSQGIRSIFTNNITALSAQLRSLGITGTGDLIINKTTAIEKITTSNVRVLQGANPFINAPASTCATSTTLFSKFVSLTNGNIVFLHAAAAQNRFGIIASAGYSVLADCKSAQLAPNVASYPVAAVYDAVNSKLIVAYAGNATTTDLNSVYAYTINEATSAITSPQKLYDSSNYPSTYPYLLYGVSDMTLDPVTGTIYIATAINTATTVVNYAIEKFTYDPTKIGTANNQVLTRVGNVPFYPYGIDTKCISGMFVGN